jgi:hypothetical protein
MINNAHSLEEEKKEEIKAIEEKKDIKTSSSQ